MTASACVSGRKRATHVIPTGIAVIGKSEPARNHGAICRMGVLVGLDDPIAVVAMTVVDDLIATVDVIVDPRLAA